MCTASKATFASVYAWKSGQFAPRIILESRYIFEGEHTRRRARESREQQCGARCHATLENFRARRKRRTFNERVPRIAELGTKLMPRTCERGLMPLTAIRCIVNPADVTALESSLSTGSYRREQTCAFTRAGSTGRGDETHAPSHSMLTPTSLRPPWASSCPRRK